MLYRAPVWASVNHPSMLSIPLPSLRCRSFVDPLVGAWGGDLGTMYLPGTHTQHHTLVHIHTVHCWLWLMGCDGHT